MHHTTLDAAQGDVRAQRSWNLLFGSKVLQLILGVVPCARIFGLAGSDDIVVGLLIS